KPYSAKSGSEAFVRGRSGHNKAKPQLGRISALAGRKSRLRACKLILQRYLLTYPAWPDLSNPSMANRRAVSHRGIPF
ncbi:hypothetical protein, partial [Citrobacter braakii]